MTTVEFILITIAIVIMVVGLFMIIRGILNRKKDATAQEIVRDKNGIPIIPRHERKLVEEPESHEEEESEITIIPDRTRLQPVIEEASSSHRSLNDEAMSRSSNDESVRHLDVYVDHEPEVDYQTPSDNSFSSASSYNRHSDIRSERTTSHSHVVKAAPSHYEESEDDLFSNLASATEKLMPMIETAEEPEFVDNSPMLDQHLLAEADQDQNSPLNHAQENINITLVPRNSHETIDGKTVLSIVAQYGLKYGAMNMFHRYENKDGSGILWFSMLGVTEEGVAPFDLNQLPYSHYNGLVLFLSLPHPKATQGFDSMMSVVNLISNDLDTIVLDENNEVLTRERRQQLRNQVQQYKMTSK